MGNSSEKCYNPQDRTLTFVDGEDELDFLYVGFKSLRAKMSCGHAVTPMSLTDHCRSLLDQGRCRFVCGQCDGEWSFQEVCKMALLTPEEVKEFEDKKLRNAAKRSFGNRESSLEILKTCPEVVLNGVKDVTDAPLKCPSTRACPTCGLLVRHDGTRCKNVGCTQCKVQFCFVCLKITTECQKLNPESWYKPCSTGVAARQTSIPVWQRRPYLTKMAEKFPELQPLTVMKPFLSVMSVMAHSGRNTELAFSSLQERWGGRSQDAAGNTVGEEVEQVNIFLSGPAL